MICRERRSWTAKEDQLLREAVEIEDPENPNPSKWHAIAKHVPNRTNKDCRKRWFAKMASDVVKGGWAPDEDERLVKGIERYGTRWSLVASVVQTRNSDQCAKRWTDTLNPAIDRTSWTPEADELLLQAVAEHGKVWTKIVKTYFPGRTGLSAKNRYNSITRFNNVDRNNRSRRRTPDLLPYHRKSESVSSSSSVSPSTPSPSLSLPELPRSPASFHSDMSSAPPNYFFDHLSQWSHSPESEASSYYPSPNIPHVKEEQFSGPIPASLTSNHPHSHSTIEPSISNYPETGLYPTHRIMKPYPEEHGSPNNYPLSPEVPLSYPHQQYPSGYQSSEGPHPISGVYDSPHQQMHWSQGSPHFDGPQGDRKQLVSSFAF